MPNFYDEGSVSSIADHDGASGGQLTLYDESEVARTTLGSEERQTPLERLPRVGTPKTGGSRQPTGGEALACRLDLVFEFEEDRPTGIAALQHS